MIEPPFAAWNAAQQWVYSIPDHILSVVYFSLPDICAFESRKLQPASNSIDHSILLVLSRKMSTRFSLVMIREEDFIAFSFNRLMLRSFVTLNRELMCSFEVLVMYQFMERLMIKAKDTVTLWYSLVITFWQNLNRRRSKHFSTFFPVCSCIRFGYKLSKPM